MTYEHAVHVLSNMMEELFYDMTPEQVEALNDGISALQTLDDMGDTMNRILREEHHA